MSALDWPLDSEGYPHRQAARILIFDDDGRVLLARGHDADQVERHWWFTIGGGIEKGESPRQAAIREAYEETGLTFSPDDLIGPVVYRCAEFDFLAVTARQDEWFFLAYAPSTTLSTRGWTELERNVIDEHRWWDIEEAIQEISRSIYPRDILQWAQRWRDDGWDGTLLRRDEVREP